MLTRAILFDLDGVLVDSTAVVERRWRAFAARYCLDGDELLHNVHGHRSVDVIGRVIDRPRSDEALRWFAAMEADPTEKSPAAAGAADMLAGLPSDRWAIVSSGSSDLIGNRLTGAGLSHPGVIVSADDVARGKPDPEGYLLGAARLGWPSTEVAVVEDAAVGVAAGLAAGSTVIAVATTHPAAKLRAASVTVTDLTRLSVEASGEFLSITARQD
jgi:sugar-phosphatase